MHLGWRRASGSTAGLNDRIVADLRSAGASGRTGALVVTDHATGQAARLFLFEGGLYAVELEQFAPDVAARLRASGVSTPHLDESANMRAGAELLRGGRIDLEHVRRVHQEFVLAQAGAVLLLRKARSEFASDAVTDLVCTLPIPVDDVVEAVRMRQERLDDDWSAIASDAQVQALRLADGGAQGLALAPTGAALAVGRQLPEFAAFLGQCNGRQSIDEVARACGFTRAEAVHLARVLIADGVVAAIRPPSTVATRSGLAVPEAFAAGAA